MDHLVKWLIILWVVAARSQDAAAWCLENCAECFQGICLRCEHGWMGRDCSYPCSRHCKYGICSDMYGCTQGCKVDWFGVNCTETCRQCPYGCTRMRCKDASEYEPATDRWTDEETGSSDSTHEWLMEFLMTGGCIVGGMLLVVLCCCCCGKKKETSDDEEQNANDNNVNASNLQFDQHRPMMIQGNSGGATTYRSPYGRTYGVSVGGNTQYWATPHSVTAPPLPEIAPPPFVPDEDQPPSYSSLFPKQ